MMESRKQFEEWALSQKWCINKTGDTYNNTYVGCSWQAWQASRAAIVVKMPKYHSFDFDYSALYDSLDDAGISYE